MRLESARFTNANQCRSGSDKELTIGHCGSGIYFLAEFILCQHMKPGAILKDCAASHVFEHVNAIRHCDGRTVGRPRSPLSVQDFSGHRFNARVNSMIVDNVQIVAKQSRHPCKLQETRQTRD